MSDSEKIEEIERVLNLSTNALAKAIGTLPQTLYDIHKGKHGISKKLAEQIHGKYPEINFEWLMAGEDTVFQYKEKIKDRFFRYLETKGIDEKVFDQFERNKMHPFLNFVNDFVQLIPAMKDKPFIKAWREWKADFSSQTVKYVLGVLKHNGYEDLDLRWLITGEGEMLLPDPKNEKNEQIEEIKKEVKSLIKEIGVLENKNQELITEIEILKSARRTKKKLT
jgi:DNA-binding XRE family transcriptional regulator